MKRLLLSFSLLLCLTFNSVAQDTLTVFCETQPAAALTEANKMYEKAISDKNSPLLIKALIMQARCRTFIDNDSYPQILAQLEKQISKETDVAGKSILHSLTAELYQVYYRNNRYVINSRIPLENHTPAQIETWSGNLFFQKIFTHTHESTQAAKQLQQVNIRQYKDILLLGNDSELLRPTVYDFLCYRSIQLLSDCYFLGLNQYFKQYPTEINPLYAGLDRFINLKLDVQPYDITSNNLRLLQKLLLFRKEAHNKIALLMADLFRLQYVNQLPSAQIGDPLYLAALQNLANENISTPYSVEVANDIAETYQQMANELPDKDRAQKTALLEKALVICNEGIQKYPAYPRIDLLQKRINNIQMPYLYANLPNNIYPGRMLALNISYKNTSYIQIEIYKIEGNSVSYLDNKNKNGIAKHRIFQQTLTTNSPLVKEDSTLNIPITETGFYEIRLNTPRQENSATLTFICSKLAPVALSRLDNKLEFFVRDAVSGKPVYNAKIRLYTYTDSYVLIDSLYTGKNGRATCKRPDKINYYQTVDASNPDGLFCHVPYRISPIGKGSDNIALFTDRKIYRPGQTVYFNGISWFANNDTTYALGQKTYNVSFYNADNNEIATRQAVSNPFGSFSGSFTIPREQMNGTFSIRTSRATSYITVAEYQRPKFEITFNFQQEKYNFGDTIRLQGHVGTYAGFSQPNSTVNYSIALHSMFRWRNSDNTTTQGVVTTDREGNFEIRFAATTPNNFKEQSYNPYFYTITASVTDDKGETQEATTNVNIATRTYQLTIEMPEKINKNRVAAVRIYSTDKQSHPIQYIVFRPKSVKSTRPFNPTDSLLFSESVFSGTLHTSGDSLVPDWKQYPSGAYLLIVRSPGKNNTVVEAKKIFYLYSPEDKRLSFFDYNWVIEEKIDCLPGETARILLGTSAKDVYVHYDVYGATGKITEKDLKLSNKIVPIDILFKKEYGEKISLIISYIKDEQFFLNIIGIDQQQPDRELVVETKVFRDKVIPGQKEQWEFCIENKAGKHIPTEIMAVMYDESLDKLMPNSWNFKPFYNYYLPYTYWQKSSIWDNSSLYMNFKLQSLDIPDLNYDALNLLGLANFNMFYSPRAKGDMRIAASGIQSSNAQADRMATTEDMVQDEQAAVNIRQNFQETAFFYPQMQSDSNGCFKIRFTVPEATTRWKFMALAHTQDMANGSIEKQIVSSKNFTITPLIPRFLRSGDSTTLKATIYNLTHDSQSGRATLELFIPSTDSVIRKITRTFNVGVDQAMTVEFSFSVPQNIGVIGCRVMAANKNLNDGEQHLIAIVPNEALLTQTLPIYSTKTGSETFKLKNSSTTKKDYRLTLELTSNPIWYAVAALPGLSEPTGENNTTALSAAFYTNAVATFIARSNPTIINAIKQWAIEKDTPLSRLEQNSELKSVLLEASPWMLEATNESERVQQLQTLFDENRLDYLQKRNLQALVSLQTPEGGWSWFKGMNNSRFITAEVLILMAKANATAQVEYGENEKMMQINALNYLDGQIKKDFQDKQPKINADQLQYLYVRSLYRDIPIASALDAHKYYIGLAAKQWLSFSLYEKAITATLMYHYGKTDIAEKIINSLKQYATRSSEMGMYWANNRSNSNLHSAISTHVAILEAFYTIKGNIPDIKLMNQWLLRQKQTESWGSTPNTVDAIYALLLTGHRELNGKEEVRVSLGNKLVPPEKSNTILGYLKESYPAASIKPDMTTVTVTKKTDAPSWGGLYLQYFERLSQVKAVKQSLSIDKRLFVERPANDGKELIAVGQTPLKTGDKVVVRLTVTTNRDMDFVHVKDLRAACFEPLTQLSGQQWNAGLSYYQESKDVVTNFFFDFLPKGVHVIEYAVWINQDGCFQDGMATLQCIYAPEFSTFSGTNRVVVR